MTESPTIRELAVQWWTVRWYPAGMVRRALAGFCAAVVSTLTFHQAMWAMLFLIGLMGPPFPLGTNRFGVPFIVSISIWRGVWGAAYGVASSWRLMSAWLSGLVFGVLVGACEWVSALLQSGEWVVSQQRWLYLLQALLVNGFWGLGLGVMLAALLARSRRASERPR